MYMGSEGVIKQLLHCWIQVRRSNGVITGQIRLAWCKCKNTQNDITETSNDGCLDTKDNVIIGTEKAEWMPASLHCMY